MLRLRPMAGFTGYMRVRSAGAHFSLLIMASDATFLSGKGYGTLANSFESAGTIVAVLAECPGNHHLPHQEKDAQPGGEDRRQPDKMGRISNKAAQFCPLASGSRVRNYRTNRPLRIK